jgi:cytochrome c peroxidase
MRRARLLVGLVGWLTLPACGDSGGGGTPTVDAGARDPYFGEAEWAQIATLSPLPDVPDDPTNRVAKDAAAARLGQSLFFDKRIQAQPLQIGKTTVDPTLSPAPSPNPTALGEAGDLGKVACASCHEPGHWHSDFHSMPRNLSLAIKYAFRNDPALVNAVFYEELGWAGTADRLWTFITSTPEGPVGGTRAGLVHVLSDHYKSAYEAIFGALPAGVASWPAQARPKLSAAEKPTTVTQPWIDAWSTLSADDQNAINTAYANACKAIAAYVAKLASRNAPFDKYVAGQHDAISTAAKRGLGLFIGKANCVACHAGPFFTDQKYHAIGVAQTGDNVPAADTGRFAVLTNYAAGVPLFSGAGAYSDDVNAGMARLVAKGLASPAPTPSDDDKGKFRTKSLRQIAETSPYMHDGVLADLPAVVDFYDQGGGDVANKDPLMKKLGLTAQEKSDLVEFLKTLTGDPIAADLTADTSAP